MKVESDVRYNLHDIERSKLKQKTLTMSRLLYQKKTRKKNYRLHTTTHTNAMYSVNVTEPKLNTGSRKHASSFNTELK